MSEMGSIIEFSSDISEEEAPKALRSGDYVAKIIAAELGTSKSSGKPLVTVKWNIAPEDFPADYEEAGSYADGKDVIAYISVEDTKAARFRLKRFCEAIGAPMSSRLDVNEWIGKTGIISIEAETFEGIERERYKKVEAK